MNFVLPPLLWLGVGGRSLPWRVLNWAIVVGYGLIAVAGAAAQSALSPDSIILLFHCGPPCPPARAGAAGRVPAWVASAMGLVHGGAMARAGFVRACTSAACR